MKTSITILLALLSIFLLTAFLLPERTLAQSPPPLPEKPTQTPVDSGLALLAAIGGGYAIKKLRGRKE